MTKIPSYPDIEKVDKSLNIFSDVSDTEP